MNKRVFVFIFSFWGTWLGVSSAAMPKSSADLALTFTPGQWTAVEDRFETNVTNLTTWLKNDQIQKKALESEIVDLQSKRDKLTQESNNSANIFVEIQLKALLNNLKDKLQENSNENRIADLKEDDFKQQCLSLIDLYNTHIEAVLETGYAAPTSALLDSKIDELSRLVRKRDRIQWILNHYGKKITPENLADLGNISSFQSNDVETLQLTMDLFKDREKDMQDQIEKWELEMDSLRNEMKLQVEMGDFLKDIQEMNTDSDFPQNNLKQEDLEFLSGNRQRKKLVSRLNDLQLKILKDQKLIGQMDKLLSQTRLRLNSLNGDQKP